MVPVESTARSESDPSELLVEDVRARNGNGFRRHDGFCSRGKNACATFDSLDDSRVNAIVNIWRDTAFGMRRREGLRRSNKLNESLRDAF